MTTRGGHPIIEGNCEGMEPTGSVVDPFPSETQMRMVEREGVDGKRRKKVVGTPTRVSTTM